VSVDVRETRELTFTLGKVTVLATIKPEKTTLKVINKEPKEGVTRGLGHTLDLSTEGFLDLVELGPEVVRRASIERKE